MDDYFNYVDHNAIKLAELATEIGDYSCAIENYSKALERLHNYQGDRTGPIMMASRFIQQIKELNGKISFSKEILKYDSWKLSKSTFIKGNQCIKYLYLDKFKKTERTPFSKEKEDLFKLGHSFEALVRETEFPDGINIKDKVGHFAYFNSYTAHLLNQAQKQIIYEASIIENDVLVMCDILIKQENGYIDIYEIKNNTALKDVFKTDLALQYAICKKRFNDKLNSFNIILRNDYESSNWKIIDLSSDLEKQTSEVYLKIEALKSVFKNDEPHIDMDVHCYNPYQCEFIEYCQKKMLK